MGVREHLGMSEAVARAARERSEQEREWQHRTAMLGRYPRGDR